MQISESTVAACVTTRCGWGFLGFTFICGRSRHGRFALKRKSRGDRMRVKLKEIKEDMRQRMHQQGGDAEPRRVVVDLSLDKEMQGGRCNRTGRAKSARVHEPRGITRRGCRDCCGG